MENSKHLARARGFTLLEVLIVGAIVAILASLSFAVFGRVRENGRRAVCQSNLRQLAIGVHQYLQDNDGRFPHDIFPLKPILPYVKDKKLFQCPSASTEEMATEEHYYFTGWILAVDLKEKKVIGVQESTFVDPSSAVLLYDVTGYEEEVESSCVGTDIRKVSHFNGANYAFVDGHVKWQTSLQAAETFCSSGLLQSFGNES